MGQIKLFYVNRCHKAKAGELGERMTLRAAWRLEDMLIGPAASPQSSFSRKSDAGCSPTQPGTFVNLQRSFNLALNNKLSRSSPPLRRVGDVAKSLHVTSFANLTDRFTAASRLARN